MQQEHNTPGAGLLPVQIGNVPITMSSREIAELCEKQHQHVRRDIEAMCVGLEIDPSTFGRIYKDARNRDQQEYALPKDLTITLVAGYNVKLRKRIIDRWMELEGAAKPLTPAEILLEQARMMVEVERKQAVIAAEQVEQSKRIATTERRLDQIETAADHFTCLGYARYVKQTTINLKEAASLGQKATKRCRELGIAVGKVPDPRFGYVNQFPKAILDEVWEEKFGRAA